MNRKTSIAIMVTIGCTLLAGGCGGGTPASRAPATPTGAGPGSVYSGRIVFRRYLDDSESMGALFTSKADGTDEQQLTHPGAGVVDDEPNWSPDGHRIVFARGTNSGTDQEQHGLYTIAPDGTDLTALSPKFTSTITSTEAAPFLAGADQGPAFSPDGKQIAFNHIRGHVALEGTHGLPPGFDQIQFSEIFVMDADGSHRRQVTRHPAYSGDSGNGVAWSPDGTALVYSRFNSPGSDPSQCRSLYVVDVAGRHSRQLTPCTLGAGGTPDWSQTDLVVFRAVDDEESGIGNFFTIPSEGGNPTQITHFTGTVISHTVRFSPDGRRIVFAKASQSGPNDVFTAALDGTHLQLVRDTPQGEGSPDWGP
jgi:TolB protein